LSRKIHKIYLTYIPNYVKPGSQCPDPDADLKKSRLNHAEGADPYKEVPMRPEPDPNRSLEATYKALNIWSRNYFKKRPFDSTNFQALTPLKKQNKSFIRTNVKGTVPRKSV
jgi:hypothetical protein